MLFYLEPKICALGIALLEAALHLFCILFSQSALFTLLVAACQPHLHLHCTFPCSQRCRSNQKGNANRFGRPRYRYIFRFGHL
ncbi:hypothetical protein C8J56DRAFT_949787 [Mycena floridula]|nr:hypothetical protein C8J56DRAFT_949787 [Mycena floridula]